MVCNLRPRRKRLGPNRRSAQKSGFLGRRRLRHCSRNWFRFQPEPRCSPQGRAQEMSPCQVVSHVSPFVRWIVAPSYVGGAGHLQDRRLAVGVKLWARKRLRKRQCTRSLMPTSRVPAGCHASNSTSSHETEWGGKLYSQRLPDAANLTSCVVTARGFWKVFCVSGSEPLMR